MDSKAVSPLIGFVLMLAIIMGLIGIMQAQWVPVWNKEVEARHLDKLSYEVADLSEAISLAASTGNPAKVVVDAGVRYPNYYVLVSPAKASGSLDKKELFVNISNVKNYTTHAILFRPNYFYSGSPLFIYEHSAVFKFENGRTTLLSEQNSFTKTKITLYIINASFNSISSTEDIQLAIFPVSYGGSFKYSGKIIFSCYSSETAQIWNQTLSEIYGADNVTKKGNQIELFVENVDVSLNYFVAVALTAGNAEIKVEKNPVGVKPLSSDYTVYRGTTVPLGIQVYDEFRNPVEGVDVRVYVDGSLAVEANTNDRGEFWFYYAANEAGTHTVTFSTPAGSYAYTIEVLERPSAAGIFEVTWLDGDHYDWDASEEPIRDFKLRVTFGGEPVANVAVDIATDNSTVISPVQSKGYTDENGEFTVTVIPLANGTANLIASAGGGVAVITLNVTNVGAGVCPSGWRYYRDVDIINNLDEPLRDFQVLITLDAAILNYTQSDCSDIVFYNGSQRLSRWIVEGTCGTNSLKIWVRVPYIPANGKTTIRMFYGSPISVPNDINTFDVVGEAGVVSVGGTEKTVQLQHSFSDPAVFAVPRLPADTYRSGRAGAQQAQHHLITSVSSSSFSIKQVTSPSKGSETIIETEVSYLVLEKGVYYIGYDLLAKVGSITGSGNYDEVPLTALFSSAPAVLADVQGAASQGNTQHEDVYARVDNVKTSSFQVQIEQDDDSTPPGGLKGEVAYAAIQQGFDPLNDFEAKQTADEITHDFLSVYFATQYSSPPSVVAQLVSEDGWNSAYAVTRAVTTTSFELAVEEPDSWDGPHTTETLSWVAAKQGLIYGRKYVDTMPTVSVGGENSC
jgi:hypothetical protein